jgi:methylenetetrahydrofolate reductase (NADPH)
MASGLSFEFFPPKTEQGKVSLVRTAQRLNALGPEFSSVTYGAGGSTRSGTRETVLQLHEVGVNGVPHLSIGSDSLETLHTTLDEYRDAGVKCIVALRGDAPSGVGLSNPAVQFANNAEALVRLIRDRYGDHFHLAVAAYPETHPDARSPASDLEFFKRKIDAGADTAITQYFYNPHAYFDFVSRAQAAHIDVPIVPGIMPITNFAGIVRFSENCGADVPRWLRKHLEALQDDAPSLLAFGADVVTRLCDDLLSGGAPGLHFYTLNRLNPTQEICANLGFTA